MNTDTTPTRPLRSRLGNPRARRRNGHVLPWLLLTAAMLAPVLAAPTAVYMRPGAGRWIKQAAASDKGIVNVRVGPEALTAGATTVLLSKPEWMELADDTAPQLAWVKLNDAEVKPGPGGRLGRVSEWPLRLSLGLRDNANPLDPKGIEVRADEPCEGVTVNAAELGPPKTNGRLHLTFPKLAAGQHTVSIRVRDMSPQANELALEFGLEVLGFKVAPDHQSVVASFPGGSYELRARRLGELVLSDTVAGYLSTGTAGNYLYIDRIERVETLPAAAPVQSVRIHALPGQTDKQQDGSKLARLEYGLTIRDDLPALLVTSRTLNLGEKRDVYTWWGWLPGLKWTDPVGEHEWAGKYADRGKIGWVFLPQPGSEAGIGWISPLVFGESRFNTMLLYSDPKSIPTETGRGVEIPFAIMPARTAAEVAEVAAKIKALGLW